IDVGSDDSLTACPLRIDEWLLHFLAGTPYLDERLAALLRPIAGLPQPPPSQLAMAQRIVQLCRLHPPGAPLQLIQLCGGSPDDQLAVLAHACAVLECRLYRMAATDVPAAAAESETLARLWERQAALDFGALAIDFRDVDHSASRHARTWLESL